MMRGRRDLLRDLHEFAFRYHWAERDILALTVPRRIAYLLLHEREEDERLLAALDMER